MTREEAEAMVRTFERTVLDADFYKDAPGTKYYDIDREEARAALIEAMVGRWRPVSDLPEIFPHDFMPHQSRVVLVYDGGMRTAFVRRGDNGEIEWISNCSEQWDISDQVKYWQPLPLPPGESHAN